MKSLRKSLFYLFTFLITFSFSTIFCLVLYSKLYSRGYVNYAEVPEPVLSIICGDDKVCLGEVCRH